MLGSVLVPLLSISGYWVFSVLIDISLAHVRQLSFLWSLFVCASSWNAVIWWLFLDTSSQLVSAPGSSFSYLLSVGSLWNAGLPLY